jgi:hypothetical protein
MSFIYGSIQFIPINWKGFQMKMFQATVRRGGGCHLEKIEVMATTAIEAKNNLEMEFGDGNVVYFPKEIR